MHRFAISILCTLLPLVLADTSYMVSNVQFWQYNKSSNYIEEIINLDAQGTTPGALRVDCDLTWNASAAAQVPATGPPLVEQFNCADPAVNITMQRMTVNFFQPWYLTVSLNNANPVTWNPYSAGNLPVRGGNFTDSNNQTYQEYIFDNRDFIISGAPSVSLPEALRQWNAPNGTSTQFSGWEQDGGGSSGLRAK